MFCDEALDAVERIAAGDVVADGRIAEHLISCPNCASALESARRVERMLRQRPVPRLPPQFTTSTLSKVRRARWQSDQWLDVGFNLGLVAIVVAVGSAIWMFLNRSGLAAVGTDAMSLFGSGLTTFTQADANHVVNFSTDMSYYVDTYSRVDLSTVSELRRGDGALVAQLEAADIAALKAAGWKPPEVFTAKGRDGRTDIWGVIYRPSNFDAAKKYPVIENIYAGPQGSFVPKSFAAFNAMQATAELGFIVVQIDGMGTNNRSKEFHDVAWKDLKDAGFEDRILWHKAAAAKYPSYDISRVGIYGTSAGGQNSLGGLLFFPDFYKVGVSSAGCHDNRMDKIWWNEQWMGWPIGEQYAASSNVDNAYRLQGRVLLVVGEMDNNVDPASTFQVVNQLIKHEKNFDLLVIPGAGHTSGGAYGDHKRYDYFVQHLLGVKPPEWKDLEAAAKAAPTASAAR